MKRFVMTIAALGAIVASAAPVAARQGCGRGFHRGHFGRCVPSWHRHRWHRW